MSERWVVVVPVKVANEGKTRLAGVLDDRVRVALVRAMALDTVAAAAAAALVGRVLVVTADPELRAAAGRSFGLVDEPGPASLVGAVTAGFAAARAAVPGASVAALLGDVPTLRPADLDDALGLASLVPLGFVPDEEGTGTTLLTARAGAQPAVRFGPGSAAAHAAAGHVALSVGDESSLRRDVDLPADLDALAARGPGPRTAALLARLHG
ncbi:2-phospho-L-lactate guanylyltransferase [Cellulomonas sp. HZM]|uniref:2-phospho-L-lactate guanylyltransferase n=1 Tax=Cellulomonas sp. HZM TaxID=1454010 RepID=UPI000492F574|nr:2-phospho-L-lactate guanylyltransferase [Cellulomonas sp. HZM]